MAWSNLKAFPNLAAQVAIASALRQVIGVGGITYSANDVAAALRAGGVYPRLSPPELVTVLTYRKVFPNLTLEQSRAALKSVGIPADIADKAFRERPQEMALN